jgi:hypothetical protein
VGAVFFCEQNAHPIFCLLIYRQKNGKMFHPFEKIYEKVKKKAPQGFAVLERLAVSFRSCAP